MKKQVIKLNESQLRNMIREAINELDLRNLPNGDFLERNKWWKQQVDNDFPNHGIENSDNWQNTYGSLRVDKDKADKLAAKAKQKEENALRRKEDAKKKRESMANRYKITKMKYKDGVLEAYLDKVECKITLAILDASKEPQGVWYCDVELYTDDTWLPYEETFSGASKIPDSLKPYFLKMLKKIGMRNDESASNLGLNESKLNRIVKESVKKALNEQLDFVDREELAKKFLQWATSNESQQKINAMEAMYEYYNNDDEEYLYRAAEVFSEVSGDDVNDVLDAAKMAANHYFYYNN